MQLFSSTLYKKAEAYRKKKDFCLSVNVFSTKVLIGDTIYGTAILRGHPSHAKVQPPAGQRKYLHFSVILRPRVLVRPRESNPRPPALQSSALPTEPTLPRYKTPEKGQVTYLWGTVDPKQSLLDSNLSMGYNRSILFVYSSHHALE